jgi:hypothetical protein
MTVYSNDRAQCWAFVCLVLTIAYCHLMTLHANQAHKAYMDERSNDIIWQQNAALQREWLGMYILNQMLIYDDLNAARGKVRPQHTF